MDPCAGLHNLAHGSIPLPYLPNLCAVLRPAPLASYYFPFLSFPLLSPCIGLSLDPQFSRVGVGYGGFLEYVFNKKIFTETDTVCRSASHVAPLMCINLPPAAGRGYINYPGRVCITCLSLGPALTAGS